MPRHLISDAHEWINEILTVPIYYLAVHTFGPLLSFGRQKIYVQIETHIFPSFFFLYWFMAPNILPPIDIYSITPIEPRARAHGLTIVVQTTR